MTEAIEASRRGFLALADGEISAPLRSELCGGRILMMPAEHCSGTGVIKVICPALGASKGIAHGVDGVVLWIDSDTGTVGAMLDVLALTALRTGAASGLASSLLAPATASVLAMLGAGEQALDQIEGVCAVRPISEVRIASRSPERRLLLGQRVKLAHPDVHYLGFESTAEALTGADVVCAATRSTSPLFELEELARDVHVNAIGAFRPDMSEVPPEAFRAATLVVVDQVSAALAEAGDVITALDSGALQTEELAELGDLLGAAQPVRSGLTIFKSVGIAAQDWSLAELVVRRAREEGLLAG
jgi:ornithine cyclodeaminase